MITEPWKPISDAPKDGRIFVACEPDFKVYRCTWGLHQNNWLNADTGETVGPVFFVPSIYDDIVVKAQELGLIPKETNEPKRVCDRCGFEIELNEYAPYNDPEETKFPLCGYCEHMMNKDD